MIHRYQRYSLHLRSSTVFARAGAGDPSLVESLAYVPGAAVRGALARAYGDPDANPAGREQFRQLVTTGEVRFLDALPALAGRRALPAPRSYRRPKHATDEWVVDLAAHLESDWPAEDLGSAGLSHVTLGAQPVAVQAALGGRTHQQRDRARGRAWVETRNGNEVPHGAVFAVESLAGDQRFEGLVQVSAADEAGCDRLIDLVTAGLSEPLLLGRSRRAGYGGDAEIEWGSRVAREASGEGVLARDLADGEMYRVLFTSACVVRDPTTGQLDPAAAPSLLARALGSEVVGQCWSFELSGGFNRKWRTEIPQASAIAPGSVVVLRALGARSIAELVEVEHRGLGERLAEGLGRFILLEPPVRRLLISLPASPSVPRPTGAPPALVVDIERRVLAAALERRIVQRGADLAADARGPLPNTSLLGRLRVPLRGEPALARQTLATWCGDGDHALKRPARAQLDRCRVDGRPLRDWITRLATDDSMLELRRLLELEALCQRNYLVSEGSAMEGLAHRQVELAAKLLDATLAALARRQKGSR